MSISRRTALLSALGIGVASRVPVETPPAAAIVTDASIRSASVQPLALTASGGWCAPSMTVYSLLGAEELSEGILHLPEITVRRGGMRYNA